MWGAKSSLEVKELSSIFSDFLISDPEAHPLNAESFLEEALEASHHSVLFSSLSQAPLAEDFSQ